SYQRSGFIHPVRTLKGEQLTRIQPADHYHHYGIWNPWTQTVFRGDTVDFWNLRKKEGTVRFARILDHEVEGRTASYTVQHIMWCLGRTEGKRQLLRSGKWCVSMCRTDSKVIIGSISAWSWSVPQCIRYACLAIGAVA